MTVESQEPGSGLHSQEQRQRSEHRTAQVQTQVLPDLELTLQLTFMTQPALDSVHHHSHTAPNDAPRFNYQATRNSTSWSLILASLAPDMKAMECLCTWSI